MSSILSAKSPAAIAPIMVKKAVAGVAAGHDQFRPVFLAAGQPHTDGPVVLDQYCFNGAARVEASARSVTMPARALTISPHPPETGMEVMPRGPIP
jgi:hypothetical protein